MRLLYLTRMRKPHTPIALVLKVRIIHMQLVLVQGEHIRINLAETKIPWRRGQIMINRIMQVQRLTEDILVPQLVHIHIQQVQELIVQAIHTA